MPPQTMPDERLLTVNTAGPASVASSRRTAPRARAWWFFLPAAFCVLAVIVYWPGSLGADATINWYGARFATIKLGQPAFISLVWRGFDRIYPNPGLMLALELLTFWLAVSWLLRSLRPAWHLALLVCVVFAAYPLLIAHSALIVKDVVAGNCGLLAFCMLLGYAQSRHRWRLVLAAFILFSLAGLFRFQLWVTSVPALIAVLAYDVREAATLRVILLRGVVAVSALALPVLIAQLLISQTFQFDATVTGLQVRMMMYDDIGAVLHAHPDAPLTEFDRVGANTDGLRTSSKNLFSLERVDPLWKPFDRDLVGVGNAEVRQQWLELLRIYPGVFLWHRLESFARLLGITGRTTCSPLLTVGFSHSPPALWRSLNADGLRESYATSILRWRYFPANTILFRPVLYLGLSILLIGTMAVRKRVQIFPSAMIAAAWLYWATYLPDPIACDVRYSYFSCVSIITAALYMMLRNLRPDSDAMHVAV